ncbi:MAG: aldo/keto reductase, partial [Anaerolineae bacterium]
MRRMKLGSSPLEVSRIALGCMRLSDDREEALRTIQAALDQGINFFDHADIYGSGERERVFSALWDRAPRLRDQIILQSKCGIRFP